MPSARSEEKQQEMRSAIAFLNSKLTAVVSYTAADGKVHSATVFYWVSDVTPDGFSVYFVTRRNARKFSSIVAIPSVAIVVGAELEPMTMQIEGEALPVDAADGLGSLDELDKRLADKPNLKMLYGGAFFPKNPFSSLEGVDFAIICVKPTWARFMHRNSETQAIEFLQVLP